MAVAKLPIELAEYLIDVLGADSDAHTTIPALAACSLVCRRWLPRTRYHLFGTLDLAADWTPEANRVTDLLVLLRNTPPGHITFASSVSTIRLRKRTWGMTSVDTVLSVLAEAGIAPSRLDIDCPAYEPRNPWLTFGNSLRDISLTLHLDMPFGSLLAYLGTFPHLEKLHLGGSARFTWTGDEVEFKPPARLQTLSVCGSNIATPLLDWLASSAEFAEATAISTGSFSSNSVTILKLRDIGTPTAWHSVLAYLASPAGPLLEQLTIHNCDLGAAPHPLTLHLLSLTTFTIIHSSVLSGVQTLLRLLAALSSASGLSWVGRPSIRHDNLTCISLEYTERPSPRQLADAQPVLDDLDLLISDVRRFSVLRRVHMCMVSSERPGNIFSGIGLPLWNRRIRQRLLVGDMI